MENGSFAFALPMGLLGNWRSLAETGIAYFGSSVPEWIKMYTSEEFTELAHQIREMADRIGCGAASLNRQPCDKHIRTVFSSNIDFGIWLTDGRVESGLSS
ncbi:MAG: hypothetical protein Ct9H300mP11_11680 [Chloroflexota bacterium]|nr:MAG: hypothetical protein Ct9H300mP11_11680 [Chloroflexota bacterium]